MTVKNEFAAARMAADEARSALTNTLVELQARINPRALARDAFTELRDAGGAFAHHALAAAKRNPAPLIGIGATVIAILAKDWIIGAFARRGKDATDTANQRFSHNDGVTMPAEGHSHD